MTKLPKKFGNQIPSTQEAYVAIAGALDTIKSVQAALLNGSVDTAMAVSLAEAKAALLALDEAALNALTRRNTLVATLPDDGPVTP